MTEKEKKEAMEKYNVELLKESTLDAPLRFQLVEGFGEGWCAKEEVVNSHVQKLRERITEPRGISVSDESLKGRGAEIKRILRIINEVFLK